MLSTDEQKALGELRRHTEHLGSARSPRSGRRTPLVFVVLWWISVLTVIAGAILPGIGMAAAVGLGWLLWRYLPESADMLEATSDVADDGDDRDPSLRAGGSPRRHPEPGDVDPT